MGEEEVLEVDVLFVGGGPASLAGAYHLMHTLEVHNGHHETAHKPTVAVIEKAAYVGAHGFSGAVMDPKALAELMPNFLDQGFPFKSKVEKEHVWFLTKNGKIPFPIIPPPMRNHGNYIVSLNEVTQWLSKKCEEMGVDIFPGFPGSQLLYEGNNVVGVKTGDKGIGKNGEKKANFEPGISIKAKVVVLGEGPRGTLTKQLVEKFSLHGTNPQSYATGVKESWTVPEGRIKKGTVIHTMGYPLDQETFGGSFIYANSDTEIVVGFVTGLDAPNPLIDPHHELQLFKLHPDIKKILEGGKMEHYGAKTIPEGGWYSMPKHVVPGCIIIGDSGSFLNGMRLKGIHLAMKSGMLAAETIVQALHDNTYGDEKLKLFSQKVNQSWIRSELFPIRNTHQGFKKGLIPGMVNVGIQMLTGGMGFTDPMLIKGDHEYRKKVSELSDAEKNRYKDLKFDGKLTFDKVSDVFASQTKHEADQPAHLLVADTSVCSTTCYTEFGNPCQRFCPANVYEMVDVESGKPKLQLNPENCVHCKTCDIADPYQIITWVPPEGEGGPNYVGL